MGTLILNPNMAPFSGFRFRESDGTLIGAGGRDLTIAKIREYRKINGLPEGDPGGELDAQMCKKHPGVCKEGNKVVPVDSPKPKEALKGRVLRWLNSQSKNASKEFASADEAKARANVCAKCPNNVTASSGCATCQAALRHLRSQIVGSRALDGRISSCNALAIDLPSAVHLNETRVIDASLPANCWRKAAT